MFPPWCAAPAQVPRQGNHGLEISKIESKKEKRTLPFIDADYLSVLVTGTASWQDSPSAHLSAFHCLPSLTSFSVSSTPLSNAEMYPDHMRSGGYLIQGSVFEQKNPPKMHYLGKPHKNTWRCELISAIPPRNLVRTHVSLETWRLTCTGLWCYKLIQSSA